MSEQELKLHVPPHSRDNIKKALAKANTIHLHAMYFDTPDRQLAKAKVAIRLRKEGDDWVQTLKMAGENSFSRIELNHPRSKPILDLSLYAGTVAEPVLTKLTQPLGLRYETDVIRLYKKQRTRKGTVEIAFDTGVVRAGRLELPINEIEFELRSGHVEAMFDIATRWLYDYDLILDTRTKSHRGDALANMMAKINNTDDIHKDTIESQETTRFWRPYKTKRTVLSRHLSATQALCRLTEECVEQIAINTAYLAEVDTAGVIQVACPEHVHQLRIGMRRLISHWKLFSGFAHLPPSELMEEIRLYLNQFGATRDTDVMLATIMPSLEKAGMPPIKIDHYQGRSATELARDNHFQAFLLKLLAWIATTPATDPIKADKANISADLPLSEEIDIDAVDHSSSVLPQTDIPVSATEEISQISLSDNEKEALSDNISMNISTTTHTVFLDIIPLVPHSPSNDFLKKIIEKRLTKWNKSIVQHWRYHDRQDIEAYHDLRKKIKRIRYSLDVYNSVEGHSQLNSYIKRLAEVQDIFGALNDTATAKVYFSEITDTHSHAWFAVGWLSAQIELLKRVADSALKSIPKKIPFQ
ncbi:CYTH and CHAD domain-containing protein [Pelistega ratti]|uniref:CYTH and CHAD domain-containing protein n=1 Tax=Pelistega ratti TaxID=2652177 RepID=UPI001359CDC1|nr:CYTH and CHAD domain-containing protein [Pelistega ratti]